MSLHARIVGTEGPKIHVHQLQASLNLWAAGILTRSQVIAAFNISAGEESELDFVKGKYLSATNPTRFVALLDALLLLTEQGLYGLGVQSAFVTAINAAADLE